VTISDQNGAVLDSSDYGNEFFFQGRTFDKESGLYYFRNRYYSPDLGRFISRDPIGYDAGDINLYRFVGNNPYGGLDPMGLFSSQFKGGLSPVTSSFDELGARATTFAEGTSLECQCSSDGKMDCNLRVNAIIVTVSKDDESLLGTYNDQYYELAGQTVNNTSSRLNAIIQHERDHYNVWKEFYDVSKTNASSAERDFNKQCDGDCSARSHEIEEKFNLFLREALDVSSDFDKPSYYEKHGLGNQYVPGNLGNGNPAW
jgi:RHS repeat-associated protein